MPTRRDFNARAVASWRLRVKWSAKRATQVPLQAIAGCQ
jgi:hypothetical protein